MKETKKEKKKAKNHLKWKRQNINFIQTSLETLNHNNTNILSVVGKVRAKYSDRQEGKTAIDRCTHLNQRSDKYTENERGGIFLE